jgi:hypothetical protein
MDIQVGRNDEMFLLENSEGYKEKSVDAIQVEDP